MSDYTYTDGDNDKLWIDKIRAGVIIIGTIGASRETEACASVYVESESAPAIALAILEAAGYGKTEAAGFVRGQVDALVKQAEREAEDAKVDNWRTFNKLRGQMEVAWKCLSDYERNEWRTNYNAARKFFEEA